LGGNVMARISSAGSLYIGCGVARFSSTTGVALHGSAADPLIRAGAIGWVCPAKMWTSPAKIGETNKNDQT